MRPADGFKIHRGVSMKAGSRQPQKRFMPATVSPPAPEHRSRSFRSRHLYDYDGRAVALWSVLVVAGFASLAWAVVRVALEWRGTVDWSGAALLAAVAFAALFPTPIPRTKYSISVADVFIFLLLAMQGVPIAMVAAALDGSIGALRTSKRISSRLSTPSASTLGMAVAGAMFANTSGSLQEAGVAADVAPSLAVILIAPLPILMSVLMLMTVVAVKNRLSLRPLAWMQDATWMLVTAIGAAFVASMLALNTRRFGFVILATGGLVVLTLVVLVRTTLRRREQERVAQEALLDAAQQEAEQNQRRFTAAFTHAAIGMAIVDRSGRVVQANRALHVLFREEGADLVGRTFNSLLHPGDAPLHAQRAAAVAGGRETAFSMELRCRTAHGAAIWAALHCGDYADASSDERCLIYQLHDITSRHVAETRLQHIAYHDALTDLANRNCFIEHLSLIARKEDALFGVCFLDLDRFKVVNDSLGHTAGNELLCAVGRRLVEAVRSQDLVARLGGDEFVILMEDLRDPAEGLEIADRVLHALALPLTINGTEVLPGASMGLTFGDMGGRKVEEILRDADLAMYEAKNAGRGRIAVFDSSMHERVAEKLSLESDLRHAIGEGKLTLQFQPIYALAPYVLSGFEALARWVHPERGAVSPAVFVALAEESGYIAALTGWVLDRSLAQLAHWDTIAPHMQHVTVNVNLSGRDLTRPDLVDEVTSILARHGIAPQRLTLEITETTLMGRLDDALGIMNTLRALGVRFSIDDFGTGYSSLAYLSKLPIDSLKIDRSFVIALRERPHNVEIVKAILTLGQALGRKIVAEGIETADQLSMLRALGVNFGQGYLLSRPLDPDMVPALLLLGIPASATDDEALRLVAA